MLDQYLNLLGKAYLVPITFIAIGAWGVKFITGLQESKRRDRKEFLEHWRNHNEMSDLEMEVTVRHLFGIYLPANLIRTIHSMPFPSEIFVQMIDAWPFVRFDHTNHQLAWKRNGYATRSGRLGYLAAWGLGYMAFAALATYAYFLLIRSDPERLETWLAALAGLSFLSVAIWLVSRCFDLVSAGRIGNPLITRINATLASVRVPQPAQENRENLHRSTGSRKTHRQR